VHPSFSKQSNISKRAAPAPITHKEEHVTPMTNNTRRTGRQPAPEKAVTRYTYDDLKEPRTPETGHTPLLPDTEQHVTLPMDREDNGWAAGLNVVHLDPADDRPVVVDMDWRVDPVLFWAGKRNKSVTHILGLRAFGSPLLTEQIIGRGLRRADYTVLNQPLAERGPDSEETVDAFGIPFVGFPVQKKKRQPGQHFGRAAVWIETDDKKAAHRIRVPNVRSWAVGVTRPLSEVVNVSTLPELVIDPKITPPDVQMQSVIGGSAKTVLSLDAFRQEYPVLKTAFRVAAELLDVTNPQAGGDIQIGPTFEELLDVVQTYLATRVRPLRDADLRDIGIPIWHQQLLNHLGTAIRGVGSTGLRPLPILGDPEWLDTATLRRFQWTGLVADGKKSHTTRVPCHSPLEQQFANFLDAAPDVLRYFKNERFGFSVTYYENNRPRQYYPDFIVAVRDGAGERYWLAETKGEMHPNTQDKATAAKLWCQKMSTTPYGRWDYILLRQQPLQTALVRGIKSMADLVGAVLT
jgi:type III restriction enzyme